MGPPPFSDGNLTSQVHVRDSSNVPSMRPPPFSDGNGRVLAERRNGGDPSMGPPPFSDGNAFFMLLTISGLVPSMGPPPFSDGNQTLFKPGQTCRCSLQWGHRLSAMETSDADGYHRPRFHPFNGATAFQRWKLFPAAASGGALVALQWGHRLSAMETVTTLTLS